MKRKSESKLNPGTDRTRRWVYLTVAGALFLGGSLSVALTGLASAAPGTSTVIANQGASGSSPWPVSGTVGVSNSGFNVNNFPSSFPVSGTVGISGTPSVTSGDQTTFIAGSTGVLVSAGGEVLLMNNTDISAYKEVTIYVRPTGAPISCNAVTFSGDGNNNFNLGPLNTDPDQATTFDPAPPKITVSCGIAGSAGSDSIHWDMFGRAN